MEIGGKRMGSQIHSKQSKSTDQIQQNFNTPTNHKKIGVIFVGNFRIWDKINKNQASNTTGRLQNHDQQGSDTKIMQGRNPNRAIFHERSGSRDEHEEHKGKTQGNHEGNTREITQPTRFGHTYARSSKHKEWYMIQSQQMTIQRSSPCGGFEGSSRDGVFNPLGGSYPKRS